MPQISLYIDKKTMDKIERAAKRDRLSISKWVGRSIMQYFEEQWPSKYFDLYSSIDDDSFTRHNENAFPDDATRESL